MYSAFDGYRLSREPVLHDKSFKQVGETWFVELHNEGQLVHRQELWKFQTDRSLSEYMTAETQPGTTGFFVGEPAKLYRLVNAYLDFLNVAGDLRIAGIMLSKLQSAASLFNVTLPEEFEFVVLPGDVDQVHRLIHKTENKSIVQVPEVDVFSGGREEALLPREDYL